MIRIILIIFFGAVLVSFSIFYFSPPKTMREDMDSLAIREENIIKRSGVGKEKFRFCSYPASYSNGGICWDESEGYSDTRSVKIVFNDDSVKYYRGIYLYLALNLKPYLEKSALEFWFKGGKNSSMDRKLHVYLKVGTSGEREIESILPIEMDEEWRKISLPITGFSLTENDAANSKNKDKISNWEIKEILFLVTPFNADGPVELFIDDLRVVSEDEVIYDLF